MTAPLVPVDLDLRDFPFMPMDISRLFGSEFHAQSDDGAWRAGVTLWLRSYHQVPAASIPDDDVACARLAEFGRDVKAWRRVKAAALRGWVKCDDGRLYHPVVAEKALEGWLEKLGQRKSSAAGNAKRYGQPFDGGPFDAAIDDAIGRLAILNPASRLLAKRVLRKSQPSPDGSPDTPPDGLPSGSQGKGREGKGIENIPPISLEAARAEKRGGEKFERFWKSLPEPDPAAKAESLIEFAKLSESDQDLALTGALGYTEAWQKKRTTHSRSPLKFLRDRQFVGFAAATAVSSAKFRHRRDSPQGRAHEADWRARLGKPPPWHDDHWYFDTDWPASGAVG